MATLNKKEESNEIYTAEKVKLKAKKPTNVEEEASMSLEVGGKSKPKRNVVTSSDQETIFIPGIIEIDSDEETIKDYISSKSGYYEEEDTFKDELVEEKEEYFNNCIC